MNPTENIEDISSSNSNLIFEFDKNNKITVKANGEEYSGDYKLNDKELSIDISGEKENDISLTIKDFEKNDKNEDLYTGELTHIQLPEKHDLNNEFLNFSENENLGFYEK